MFYYSITITVLRSVTIIQGPDMVKELDQTQSQPNWQLDSKSDSDPPFGPNLAGQNNFRAGPNESDELVTKIYCHIWQESS